MKYITTIILLCLALNSIGQRIEAEDYYYFKGYIGNGTTSKYLWVTKGTWVGYTVNVPLSGTYDLTLRVEDSTMSNTQVKTTAGTVIGSFYLVPGYWKNISLSLGLPAGKQVIWLYSPSGLYKLDWIELVPHTSIEEIKVSLDSIREVLRKNVIKFDTMFDWTTTDTLSPDRAITIPSLIHKTP